MPLFGTLLHSASYVVCLLLLYCLCSLPSPMVVTVWYQCKALEVMQPLAVIVDWGLSKWFTHLYPTETLLFALVVLVEYSILP